MVREGRFPAPIRIGERAVGWVEREVDEWQRERIGSTQRRGALR